MILIANSQCETCQCTMAYEADNQAVRVFCTGCGRGWWVEVPEDRTAVDPVGYASELRTVGRRCLDCHADISKRHPNSVRCADCAVLEQRRQKRASRDRRIGAAA